MSEPVRLTWDLKTKASLETTWALLSDTDAFNRVAGMGFKFTEEKQADGTLERTGHMQRLGMHLTWEERPWRFRAPEWFAYERRFHGGPASQVAGQLRLEPIPGGGTRIRYEVAITPSSLFTRPIVMLDATVSTRPQLETVLRKAIAALDEGATFDKPPPLDPQSDARLEERTANVAGPVGAALRAWLREAPLPAQNRIRPLQIARRAGVDEAEAVRGLLQAVRDGALTLRWELLCPSCLGPKASLVQLPTERAQVHCESCDIVYDGTFPDSVEVVFRPDVGIRPDAAPVDCALSPGRTPHVVAQFELAPTTVTEEQILLSPGAYRIRVPGGGASTIVEVAEGEPAEATIDVNVRGVLPSVLRVAPGPVKLTLRSRLRAPSTVIIDRRWRPPDALSAGRLLQMPGARELLPEAALAAGSAIETGRRYVLVVESPRDAEVVRARFAPTGGRLYTGNGVWIAVWERALDAIAGAELLSIDSRASGAIGVGPVVEVGEERIPSGPAVDAALECMRRGGGARFAFTGDAWRDPEVKEALATFAERVAAVSPTPAGDVRIRFPTAEKARRDGIVDRRKQAGPDKFAGMYKVLGMIAEGGFGRVLSVQDVDGQMLAIKVLKPEAAEDPLAVQLFYNEARIASSLRSVHVVRVYDYGETEEDELYIVMERLKGQELAKALDPERLTPDRAVRIAMETLEALEEAHAAGIVHRDIKPDNVFLTLADGNPDFVKVLDFGVAMRQGAPDPGTDRGLSLGTPLYMSPEQLENDPVDGRSDLYAVGLVLYRALSGTLPWEAPQPVGVVYKRLREPGRPLGAVSPQAIPPAIEAVVMRAISRDPADRYATAREMREALQSALSSSLTSSSVPSAATR